MTPRRRNTLLCIAAGFFVFGPTFLVALDQWWTKGGRR